MSDRRDHCSTDSSPEAALRLRGDPGLTRALRRALSAVGGHGAAALRGRSTGLTDVCGGFARSGSVARPKRRGATSIDVYATRQSDPAPLAQAARSSAANGRAFLRIEIVWGRGVIGPLTRPGGADACFACAPAASERDAAGLPEPTAAEPGLLPGLVAAVAAAEIETWLRGETPAAIDAQLRVTPYLSWALAAKPVLLREALWRRPSCPLCGPGREPGVEVGLDSPPRGAARPVVAPRRAGEPARLDSHILHPGGYRGENAWI